MSDSLDVAQQYFDAWNAHDAGAIANVFSENGEYHDPNVNIRGRDINNYAQPLWEAFPDLSFDLISKADCGNGTIAAQWRMKGTNTGPYLGLPPTGKKVLLSGADFIKISGDKIESVTGYFDSKPVPEQLGLQVIVQPNQLGPFSFGYSVLAQTGKLQKPGAFSLTTIWNAEEDTVEVQNRSRDIAKELLQTDGVIGIAMFRSGNRGVTLTAWESPEAVRQIMQSSAHNEALKRFWDNLGEAGYTSVWEPHHYNIYWVRCKECKKMNDFEKNDGQCACGSRLPSPRPYF